MIKYFRIFIFLFIFIILLGPIFSVVLSFISKYLNSSLGDWLSFYGSISGIVISVLLIHFQISQEKHRELLKYRPEFVLSYDYQLIKPNCRVRLPIISSSMKQSKMSLAGCIRPKFCFTVLTLQRLSTIRQAATGLRVRKC